LKLAKIVYGLSGEGSGHSSRSREMITHLEQLGHTVKAVSYDRGYHNLKDEFDVFETEGLHIASSNLDDYRAEGNGAIKAKLGELLADNCLRARAFHRKRRK
jgi:hypothetical protein